MLSHKSSHTAFMLLTCFIFVQPPHRCVKVAPSSLHMFALSEAVLCTAGPLGQRALINCPCTTHTLYLLCHCTGGDADVLVFPGDLHSCFLVVKPNCSEVVVCGCGQLWLTTVEGGGSGVCVCVCLFALLKGCTSITCQSCL